MKTSIVLLGFALVSVGAKAECLNEETLRSLDAQFEQALATGQLGYFDEALHADFVWVHNHAGMVQRSRQEVVAFLEEVSARTAESTQDRIQRDVEVMISEASGVVYGFTDVARGGRFPDALILAWPQRTRTDSSHAE